MLNKNTMAITALLFSGLFINAPAFSADAVQFAGSTPVQTEIDKPMLLRSNGGGDRSADVASKTKTVYLQKLILSDEIIQMLSKRVDKVLEDPAVDMQSSGNAVLLGMNDVPVLNQGIHGTCATFATTAAVDAYLGYTPRDYVSPMCNLELGNYLHKQNTNYPSGWDGSWGTLILRQMADYGIISNANCPEPYTEKSSKTGIALALDSFNAKREMVMQNVPYTTLVDYTKLHSKYNPDTVLSSVKTALQNGHRVLIGSMIVENADGDGAGVNGLYHSKTRDAWVLSPKTALGIKKSRSGHEMVITGFDDNAVAVEVVHPGKKGGPKKDGKHPGVFTLRNSWGKDAGDKGDYYMSYDFFKAAFMELNEIG